MWIGMYSMIWQFDLPFYGIELLDYNQTVLNQTIKEWIGYKRQLFKTVTY